MVSSGLADEEFVVGVKQEQYLVRGSPLASGGWLTPLDQ